MHYSSVEEFFLTSIQTGKVFEIIERSDYLFLYHIYGLLQNSDKSCVYMAELAEDMNISVVEVSRAIKNLDEKGYVNWQMDADKEHTFVTLTKKAYENLSKQKGKLQGVFTKIKEEISDEEMKTAISVVTRILNLLQEKN